MNRRPQLSIMSWAGAEPSAEEAAAVIAAVERFMRDTAPVPVAPEPAPEAWQQAALHEGVARAPGGPGAPWA